VEFAVLGRVEVRIDGRAVPLGGPKQRGLLALLLLNANEVVSRDRLIDGLWGERAPASAQRSLDSYVSRLRTLLGGDRIDRDPPGYLLHVEPDELDLTRFEALLEQGRAAAAAGDATTARDLLREGLALWRGRALADLDSEPFVAVEAVRLEERRLLAVEARIEADVELGGGSELVGELERLVSANPFQERLLAQLMLSLYRAGRQADALAAYQVCRRRFAEELGLEPGPELRALERRILGQDPTLDAVPASPSAARSRRITRARIVAAAVALVVVAASVTAGIELGTAGSSGSSVLGSTDGIFELGTGSSALAESSLTDAPAAMAADARSLWLAEPNASEVVRVDRASGKMVEQVPVSGSPASLAIAGGAVWVASVPGNTLTRIDPTTDNKTAIGLGGARAAALAFGLGRLWVADPTDAALLAIDPVSGEVVQTLQVDVHSTSLAVAARTLWVADYSANSVTEIDPRSGETIASVSVGHGPAAVAVDGDRAVWVANSLDSTVSRIDPVSGRVVATISVGSDPVALAVNGTSVWVANEYASSVSRIDARRDVVVRTSPVGGGPTALASAAGRIWVGTRALGARRGGTLVLLHTHPLLLDPALQVDLPGFQSNGLTNDALLSYIPAGGPQALQLVPDLALSVPAATGEGTSYTFRLRPGIRYSNGQLVRAEDFRRAIERIFRLQSPRRSNYTSIVGTTACTRAHCDLKGGIVTDDATGTITFHLSAANPDFLSNLALIASTPVPRGTPFHPVGAPGIPGTGPYIVASANKHEIRYIRNPRFHEWSHAAQPDGNPDTIVMRYGLSPAQEVREVEAGKADWTADGVPAPLLREVTTRYPAQAHSLLTTETDYLQFDTKIPPFNDPRVRQALNLAIDRAAIDRLYGGRRAATTTCQVLPPGILGYRRYCPWTRRPSADGRWRAPDLARARRLVALSGTRGERVTVWGPTDGGIGGTEVIRYAVRALRQLGYRVGGDLHPSTYFAHAPASLFARMQVSTNGWEAFTPNEFIGGTFTCSAYNRWFCDHRLDRMIGQALTLEATDTRAASLLWTKIDHDLVDQAAEVPTVNPHFIDFVSKHVHNYQADPDLGLIADQVSLR
jgi:peptide/nickel transport system substrate-binding protein